MLRAVPGEQNELEEGGERLARVEKPSPDKNERDDPADGNYNMFVWLSLVPS